MQILIYIFNLDIMKNDHEKLKEICDEIGYRYRIKTTQAIKSPYCYCKERKEFGYDFAIFKTDIREDRIGMHIDYTKYEFIIIDIREIIFTQEFMDKYMSYFKINGTIKTIPMQSMSETFNEGLMNNLDDPTTYLYKLLGLGTE